jgi:dihydrofolate reductase
MRKIIITQFVSLDGVVQAPGGPEEDPTGGFSQGGWFTSYFDEMMGNTMDGFISGPFDLLLGRRTYEIFAAHWPYIEGDPMGELFTRVTKFVVSRKPMNLDWKNSQLVSGDVVAELRKLKAGDGPDLWVHGSGELVQTLLANGLVDRVHVWTAPVLLGPGKRFFGSGTRPQGLKLVDSKVSTTGVIIATYEPDGEVKIGSFALEIPTQAELDRRKRMAEEELTNP